MEWSWTTRCAWKQGLMFEEDLRNSYRWKSLTTESVKLDCELWNHRVASRGRGWFSGPLWAHGMALLRIRNALLENEWHPEFVAPLFCGKALFVRFELGLKEYIEVKWCEWKKHIASSCADRSLVDSQVLKELDRFGTRETTWFLITRILVVEFNLRAIQIADIRTVSDIKQHSTPSGQLYENQWLDNVDYRWWKRGLGRYFIEHFLVASAKLVVLESNEDMSWEQRFRFLQTVQLAMPSRSQSRSNRYWENQKVGIQNRCVVDNAGIIHSSWWTWLGLAGSFTNGGGWCRLISIRYSALDKLRSRCSTDQSKKGHCIVHQFNRSTGQYRQTAYSAVVYHE